MSIWLIVALIGVAVAAVGGAVIDPNWRLILKDVQALVGGTIVLAAALIAYRGTTMKISADRADAESARRRKRKAFSAALLGEVLALLADVMEKKQAAKRFTTTLGETPRRDIVSLRLDPPKLGISEWEDLGAMGDSVAHRYYIAALTIAHANRFIEAVEVDAGKGPTGEVAAGLKQSEPFHTFERLCGHIEESVKRLMEAIQEVDKDDLYYEMFGEDRTPKRR